MLEVLDSAIDEAHQKVESGRVYDAENEKVWIKWIRALAYAVNVEDEAYSVHLIQVTLYWRYRFN